MDTACGTRPANGVAYLAAAANLIRQTDAESSLLNSMVPRAIQTVTIATSGNANSANNGRLSDSDSDDSTTSGASAYHEASAGSNVEYDVSTFNSQTALSSSQQYHTSSVHGRSHAQERVGGDFAGSNGSYGTASTSQSSNGVLPVGQVAQIGSQLYVVMPAGSHDIGRLLTSATPSTNSAATTQSNLPAVKRERPTSVGHSPHDSGAIHTLAVAAAYQVRCLSVSISLPHSLLQVSLFLLLHSTFRRLFS